MNTVNGFVPAGAFTLNTLCLLLQKQKINKLDTYSAPQQVYSTLEEVKNMNTKLIWDHDAIAPVMHNDDDDDSSSDDDYGDDDWDN